MSLRRSARLAAKGTGAPLPPTATVKFCGCTGEVPHESRLVQTLEFSSYWREKDYGDGVMEDWYYTIRCTDNMGQHQSLSFWRNFIYFGPNIIYFGYYGSHVYIIQREGACFLEQRLLGFLTSHRLAASFDVVAAKLKAATKDINTQVQNTTVHSFHLGDIPADIFYYESPKTCVSLCS
jgi:hypothetical protein